MFQNRIVSMRALRAALLSSLFFAPAALADEPQVMAPNALSTRTEAAHWGYAQTLSPAHWGELMGSGMCSTGQQQSPIGLRSSNTSLQHVGVPSFHYQTSGVHMLNTGHTVEFTYDVGSSVHLGGNVYPLKQFHFHTPSEHAVDHTRYPMEMHLVHADANGNPALVVAVFIKAGAVNNVLLNAFSHLPKHAGQVSSPLGAVLNAGHLLPHDKDFFQYMGSLTTPPCSEGIQWYVLKNPIELSDAQIAEYQRLPHLNPSNRPLQPLNGRDAKLHPIPHY
ncbi:carbonic anhydrase [Pyxidicoccus sp. 3LFB2]